MKNNRNVFLWLFVIFSLVNIVAEVTQSINLIFATKPILMILLSLWFYLETKEKPKHFTRYILGGFVFSIFGDTFLMFNENGVGGEVFFLLGLGSFLITHLFYVAAFLDYKKEASGFVGQNKWLFLPFAIFLIMNTALLWKGIPMDMKIPVIVYSSAIVAMTMSCLNLKIKIPKETFQIVFGGVLLFLISDTFIGINKFHTTLPFARILIMIPYLLGQYFIGKGAIRTIE
ncbi:MAG: putative membrane protein YhhN [Saprospiraceae bacterium]|jgi:uncharacterized membrane protein YhhN